MVARKEGTSASVPAQSVQEHLKPEGAALCVKVGAIDAAPSDAGDVGGEEVDAVSVEVAAGAVVVLGGSRVGVSGEDLGVA